MERPGTIFNGYMSNKLTIEPTPLLTTTSSSSFGLIRKLMHTLEYVAISLYLGAGTFYCYFIYNVFYRPYNGTNSNTES